MSLRITGGTARGRVLRGDVPRGVRPTGARVREAFFSVLGHHLDGVAFLDAFAGSGIMSLEAWSRGATVTAVERNAKTARSMRARIDELGADIALRTADVLAVGASLGSFDVVYVDPPFARDPAPIVERLSSLAPRMFLEADANTATPVQAGTLKRVRSRGFGSVVVHEYRSSEDA